jgi:polyhydroxyalkanoate synthesis regulator phasin
MKKIIASLAAASVLVAGAFVASAVTVDPADAQTGETNTVEVRPEPGAGLDELMAELVADGTLTQAQADTVKERLVTAREEHRADRQERHEARKENRAQIREFLEDDVISADELAQLSDDHPFLDPEGPLGDALEDGQITKAELEAARDVFKAERKANAEGATA